MEDKFYLCLLTKYGNWLFKSREAYYNWQHNCDHKETVVVHGQHHDYTVCARCLKVISEKLADHHPDISRFHDDGGPALVEVD